MPEGPEIDTDKLRETIDEEIEHSAAGSRMLRWVSLSTAILAAVAAVASLRAGDTVIIPPNTRQWHGSAPDKLFSHLAMSETTDTGEGTAWFEQVSDADYTAKTAPVT